MHVNILLPVISVFALQTLQSLLIWTERLSLPLQLHSAQVALQLLK